MRSTPAPATMANRFDPRSAAAARSDFVIRRRRTIRRHAQLERRIGIGGFRHAAGLDDLALQAVQVEMRRTRRAGHRLAPRLAQQPRQVGGGIDVGGELGHRRKHRMMRNLLIGIAMLMRRRLAAGDRDDRAAAETRILQPRRQVRRADRLREADARPAGDARVAVRHVGDGLLAVPQHALHAQRAKLDQRAADHRIDEEHMRGAIRLQAARQPFGAGQVFLPAHVAFPSCGGSRRRVRRTVRPRRHGTSPDGPPGRSGEASKVRASP